MDHTVQIDVKNKVSIMKTTAILKPSFAKDDISDNGMQHCPKIVLDHVVIHVCIYVHFHHIVTMSKVCFE